ncbi:MAG: hypothetical protein WAV28_06635 [Sedimentisphaerales bacterium]|jgi:hypothetical protein
MAYKRLWVLLEGNDDERFFERLIKPIFENTYDFVRSWQYAQTQTKTVKDFLRSIKSMSSDYFFWGDINNLPCVTAKKNRIKRRYGVRIDLNNVIIVVKEIESWYLAGLDDKVCKELGVRTFRKTDNITKEKFQELMPRKFDSRIDFMFEILKRFSMNTAKRKNKSFNYFTTKL